MLMLMLGMLSCPHLTAYESPTLYVSATEVADARALGVPQQKAAWEIEPTIRLCASTEILSSRLKRAIFYWEGAGYSFGEVTKDPLSTCMNARAGEIIITLPESGFRDEHMASTRIYTDNHSGAIVKAKICILPKNGRKDRVLEHEIGHALGWSHYRQKLHIMHPNWYLGGYDTTGIRKR
jgi:hypothetical protein